MNKLLLSILVIAISIKATSQRLTISANGRYIQTVQGKPFLWIGDTAWELLHKLDKKETAFYLKTRKKQGFTVIQTVILAEDSGLTKGNAYGELPFHDLDPARPNEVYFKHIDYVIGLAEKMGLYLALLPTWADKLPSDRPGNGPVLFNVQNAEQYGVFLAKRYAGKNIIWILGGDRNINEQNKPIWQAMAKGLNTIERQLMSYHPAGEQSSAAQLHQEEWLSFNMYQTGHARRFIPVYRFARHDYAMEPVKPFLDAEPAYEDIPVKFWEYISFRPGVPPIPDSVLNEEGLIAKPSFFTEGFFTDQDVRITAYWNLLSGACGYTYGNNAVWQFFSKKGKAIIPCLFDWKAALKRPGAMQLIHLKKLFTKWSFTELVPCQQLILSRTNMDRNYIASAVAQDSSFAITYSPLGMSFTVDLRLLPAKKLQAYWFNPRNGRLKRTTIIKNKWELTIKPPSGEDWLFIMEKS